MADRVIKTFFICPEIPLRHNDYCAWYDDEGEECGRYGWGETEEEAANNLKQKYGE